MDLYHAIEITKQNIIFSERFPYRTGQLRDNFFDEGIIPESDNSLSFTVMSNPKIYYGKILQVAPSIRYKIHKVSAGKFKYVKHANKHFRFIDKIIDESVVSALETDLGVRRI